MERIWNHPAFLGVFGDPYLRQTVLEKNGCPLSCHQSINLLCELLTADTIDSAIDLSVNTLQRAFVIDILIPKLRLCSQWIHKSLSVTDSISFTQFLREWQTYLHEIQPGNSILIPSGYNQKDQPSHLLFFVLQCVQKDTLDDTYDLTICNKGPGADLYHPMRIQADGYCDKLRVKSSITIHNINGHRMLDPTFWALAFSLWLKRPASEYHRVEVLYDVLLPWLSGESLLPIDIHELDEAASDYHSVQRSGLGYFKSLIEAIRFLCLTASYDNKPIFQPKEFKFGLLFRLCVQFGRKLLDSLNSLQCTTRNISQIASLDAFRLLYGLTLMDSLQKNITLTSSDGSSHRIIALYFADFACKRLTNNLVALSESLSAKNKEFIVVVVSLDPDPAAFQILTASLPTERWLIIPFSETNARSKLVELLQIRKAPSLFFLNEQDRNVITCQGTRILENDPNGEHYPWHNASKDLSLEPITSSEYALIEMAIRQLGKKAVVHHNSKHLSSKGLEEVYNLIQSIDKAVKELQQLPIESSNSPEANDTQKRDTALFRREIPFIQYSNIELLPFSANMDAFAGDTHTGGLEAPQNTLIIPKHVDSIMIAIGSLVRCQKLCKLLIERSLDTSFSSKVFLHHQIIRTITQLFVEALPVPIIENKSVSNIWGEPLSHKLQLWCLRLISELTIIFAYAWQSIEHPTRSFDAERSLTAICGLAIFDAVMRTPAHDDPMVLSLLLNGSFHGSNSIFVLAHTFSSSNLSIAKTTHAMELVHPSFAITRGRVLAYFDALDGANAGSPSRQLFTYHMHEDTIEMDKYSSTLQCVYQLVEQYGISLINPDDPNPPSEMEALMEWFCSSTTLCPEVALTRDFVLLSKFLMTMESRETELLYRRKPHSIWQNWQLTHTDASEHATRQRTRNFDSVVAHAFKWKVTNIRGHDQNIADIQVHLFGDRKVVFSDGVLLQSPSAIGALMAGISLKNGLTDVTEDDILHADALPTFDGTLSMEEAEYLLSFMTVPYTRIPLLLNFFASGDRVMYLFHRTLQRMLYSVLFEVGNWVHNEDKRIESVPLRPSQDHLGTRNGALLNELLHAANAVLSPIETILKASIDLARCSVYSPSALFIFFAIKLCADITRYTHYALRFRGNSSELEHSIDFLSEYLAVFALETLEKWLEEAETEQDISTACIIHSYRTLCVSTVYAGKLTDERIVQRMGAIVYVRNWHRFGSSSAEINPSTQTCPLSAQHRLLRWLQAHGINTESISSESMETYMKDRPLYLKIGLQTVRVPNFQSLSPHTKRCSVRVLEAEMVDVLHAQSRDIVAFMDAMDVPRMHSVLDRIVRIALRSSDATESWSWLPVDVMNCPGRYRCERTNLQLDLQTGEMLWRHDALRPVPDGMTQHEEYKQIFGNRSLHCGVVSRQEHRYWVSIVGTPYELLEWDAPSDEQGLEAPIPCQCRATNDSHLPMYWECSACTCSNYNGDQVSATCQVCGTPRVCQSPRQPEDLGFYYQSQKYSRAFDPFSDSMEAHEQWIGQLLRKTKEIVYPEEKEGFPFTLFLPTHPMDPNCNVVHLLAFDQQTALETLPTYKEIILYRVFGLVHIFALISHGRRVYRQQIFTLDTRISLHEFEIETDAIGSAIHSSPTLQARTCQPAGSSLVIRRYNETLRGSEEFVPCRLLQGIVPTVLLEAFTFWLGDDNILRGDPLNTDSQWFRYRIEMNCGRKILIRKPISSSFSMIATGTPTLPSLPFQSHCDANTDDNVVELMAMGFSNAACRLALKETGNKLDDAAEWLWNDENRDRIRDAKENDEMCVENESKALLLSLGFSKCAVEHALYLFDHDTAVATAWLSHPENKAEIERVEHRVSPATERTEMTLESVFSDTNIANDSNDELYLLNPLNVPNDSTDLLRLISLITRLENLSHVLIWCLESHIECIEFPRLQLTLFPQIVKTFDDNLYVKLFLNEQNEWFVSSKSFDVCIDTMCPQPLQRMPTHFKDNQKLFEWAQILPEAIFIESFSHDLQLLCPNYDVYRPVVRNEAFSVAVASNRSSKGWMHAMETRYYLYDIHSSNTFLLPSSSSASLYVLLLAILTRHYTKAMQMIPTCTIDTTMTPEEVWILKQFRQSVDDRAPDACACRLQLTLAIGDTNQSVPWDVSEELYDYIVTQKHVSALCRLSVRDEVELFSMATERMGKYQLFHAREAYCHLHSGNSVPRVSYNPFLRVGGISWLQMRAYTKAYLHTNGKRLSMVRYVRPNAEPLALLWDTKWMRDDVCGSTSSLGFLYLYEILCGALPTEMSRQHAISFVELMTRTMHLKMSRWGRCTDLHGEHASLAISLLAMMLPDRSHVDSRSIVWPQLSIDAETSRLLMTGVQVYADAADKSVVRAFFDNLHTTMEMVLLSESHTRTRTRIESLIARLTTSHSVHLKDCPTPLLEFRASDTLCDSLTYNAKDVDPVHPFKHVFNVFEFVEFAEEHNKVFEKLPFDLSQHPVAKSPTAKDLLARLEEDIANHAAKMLHRQQAYVIGLTPHALSTIDILPTCRNACIRLETLCGKCIEMEAQDRIQVTDRIVELEKMANSVLPIENDVTIEQYRRYVLEKRSGRYPFVTFDFLISLLMARDASLDLFKRNRFSPFQTEKAMQRLRNQLIDICLLCGRIIQSRAIFRAVHSAKTLLESVALSPSSDTREQLLQSSKHLAALLTSTRSYFSVPKRGKWHFDPRFLVFEFVFDLTLRRRQVEMIQSFLASVNSNQSRVQQMIMGAGKTTVVGPLLTLMLASKEQLIMHVMPTALLEQTRRVLRNRFSTIVFGKRILTLNFDRNEAQDAVGITRIYRKLIHAQRDTDVVCACPETIKSLILKFIELLHSVEEATTSNDENVCFQSKRFRKVLENRSEMADSLHPILHLWKSTVLIMDEVDVLLHPLRSELNFPLGDKHSIDLAPIRWEFPIFLLDCVVGSLKAMTYGSEFQRALTRLKKVIEDGYESHALQRFPHLILLDTAFYTMKMAPILAELTVQWISTHISIAPSTCLRLCTYLHAPPPAVFDVDLSTYSFQLVNLAREWIVTFLPHVLSKINRVSYGLLDNECPSNNKSTGSRGLLAVPFIGKDVPSRSSEFAHPDILIGMTVLAYRYEGLRMSDFSRVISQLQHDLSRQIGPRSQRPASKTFQTWIHLAQSQMTFQSVSILPLSLIQMNDSAQQMQLFSLMATLVPVIHYYLCQHVFPTCIRFQKLQISASGFDLGSSFLFGKRIGFSGTPSNVLPMDLNACRYEPLSDGGIFHALTDPKIVTIERKWNWNATTLLLDIARAKPPFHALIDTGALITGYDNAQVAEFLLAHLPMEMEGVVFLDRDDRPMILLRDHTTPLALSQCDVNASKRFTFYDQVHTTGMDIRQCVNARAVLTLGKDTTFRDFAQGAYRMRGITIGQSIHLYLIPEVECRIHLENENISKEIDSLCRIAAWLLINSMRTESMQFVQLSIQELHTIWRKRALRALMEEIETATADGVSNAKKRVKRFLQPPEFDTIKDVNGNASERQTNWLGTCIQQFRQEISYSIDECLPDRKSFLDTIEKLIVKHEQFLTEEEDWERVRAIEKRFHTVGVHEIDVVSGFEHEYAQLNAQVVHENEIETEEQAEHQVEQEEQKMSAFARDEEHPICWAVDVLRRSPKTFESNTPFYRLSSFQMNSQCPKIHFPSNLYLSNNFHRSHWVGIGERRLRNCSLLLEWSPSVIHDTYKAAVDYYFHQRELYHTEDPGLLAVQALQKAEAIFQRPQTLPSELLERWERLWSQLPIYVLIVSLAEGETLRRILHQRHSITRWSFLRVCMVDGTMIDDDPPGLWWVGLFRSKQMDLQENTKMIQCARYFNNEMYYSSDELEVLLKALDTDSVQNRQKFFEECMGCRRRERHLYSDTPLAKICTSTNEWHLINDRARFQRFQRALCEKEALLSNAASDRPIPNRPGRYLVSALRKYDVKNDGSISMESLLACFQQFRLGYSPLELDELVQFIKTSIGKTEFYLKDICRIFEISVDECELIDRENETLRQSAFDTTPNENREFNQPQESDPIELERLSTWQCSNCTCYNLSEDQYCDVCQFDQQGRRRVPTGEWICAGENGGCTFFNSMSHFYCQVCHRARPDLSSQF